MPETFTEVHHQLSMSKVRQDEQERAEKDQLLARRGVRRYCKFHVEHGRQQAVAEELYVVLGL